MKNKLKSTCDFREALENKGEDGYVKSELCYIRAYYDGGAWDHRVFPINWSVVTPELRKEADAVYTAFQKVFPDLNAVREFVEHASERDKYDPTEGDAYLEGEHGLYWFRMITRKGDYNLYLHVLSKAAPEEHQEDDSN